jgi:hypothetical protein
MNNQPETIITHYRDTSALLKRAYRDEEIRTYVLALNRVIKQATFQGADDLAFELATALHMCEPLETRAPQDREGALLQIAYLYHIQRKQEKALLVALDGYQRFPDDPQLKRIVDILSAVSRKKANRKRERRDVT